MTLRNEYNRLLNESIISDASYYQFSLFADKDGKFTYSIFSSWGDWSDAKLRHEIREPSIVNPVATMQLFREIGEPVLIINNYRDLSIHLLLIGGNSIIEKSLADQYMGKIFQPSVNVFAYDKGFVDINSINCAMRNRAPNPKLRMRIFKRDNMRCKICGASPKDNEHVVLHLHHIIPFSIGGLTDEKNLVTLCHTCHNGLDPHLDYSLFDIIGVKYLESRMSTEKYTDKIRRNISFNIERIKIKRTMQKKKQQRSKEAEH